ncbi:MAG: YggT family protein [Candidatus Melainabacteria bacterium]|nr:YggT family protein [Candidatus Melainabacteria bacterium]
MDRILFFCLTLVELYKWVLIARILLSWIPSISWYEQPWQTLDQLTEPVMGPFRRLIPPLGGLDLSPVLLFLLINLIQGALRGAMGGSPAFVGAF